MWEERLELSGHHSILSSVISGEKTNEKCDKNALTFKMNFLITFFGSQGFKCQKGCNILFILLWVKVKEIS